MTGYLKGRVLLLPEDRTFVVGSSLECDLTMFGVGVKDRHATITPNPKGRHRIKPTTDSLVLVDGDAVPEEGEDLDDGEELLIGKHRLRYLPLLGSHAINTSNEFSLDESGESVTASATCISCGDTLGPDPDAIRPGEGAASLQALRLVDGVVCPRCVDRRLETTRDLGEFRVLRKTASNELEVTYLAVEIKTGRRVGLRILKAERCGDEAIVRRYLVRALVGLALNHPSFVEVLSVSATKGITFVVMEHVETAQKLERIIRDKTPIPTARALLIVNQLAEVLRFGRERGVVVAKRKRTGILVDKRGWVKVLSFDVTREMEERLAKSASFQQLAAGGSKVPFTAPRPEPESLLRLAPERAEILGLARIYFQLISGVDYEPRSAVKAIHKALSRPPGSPLGEPPLKDKKARSKADPTLDHVPRAAIEILNRLHKAPNEEGALSTLESVAIATKACYLGLSPAERAESERRSTKAADKKAPGKKTVDPKTASDSDFPEDGIPDADEDESE